jgi:hypothetical protein
MEEKPGIVPTPVQTPALAEGPEVSSELSKVATNPKRNIAILVVFVAIFVYIAIQLFSNDAKSKKPAEPVVTMPSNVIKPVEAVNSESGTGRGRRSDSSSRR